MAQVMKTSRFMAKGMGDPPEFGADPIRVARACLTIYEICMARSETIFAASQQVLTLALLVLPQASILEVASALDPLRSANRHLGREAFRWRVVTPDGRPAPLTCGIELPSSGPLSAAEGADALVVILGYRRAEVVTPALVRDLARLAPRFAALGAYRRRTLAAGAGRAFERPPRHGALGRPRRPRRELSRDRRRSRPLGDRRPGLHRWRRRGRGRPDAAPDRQPSGPGACPAGGGELSDHAAPRLGPANAAVRPHRPATRGSTHGWPGRSPGWRRGSTRPNPPPRPPAPWA